VFQKNTVTELQELLSKPKKIVVTSHKNPDGDALGSSLAWTKFLTKLGHSVDYISPNDMPDYYHWLPLSKQTIIYEKAKDYAKNLVYGADIVFSLDYNALGRMDEFGDVVKASKANKVMIDHHLYPEEYPILTYSDTSKSSTGEMIYEMIYAMGEEDKIDSDIATLLYTAILTDTGSFAFSCTTQRVHEIVGVLVSKGADPDAVQNYVYNCFTENRLRFFGYCLVNKMKLIPNTKIAYIGVSEKELEEFGIKDGETEGLANYPLKIADIHACAFFREKDKQIRISFRSKADFDVNVIAREHFNGGGHKNASGGMSRDTLENTILKFENLFISNS
jgi:phosphoesterase RecJ-like protein